MHLLFFSQRRFGGSSQCRRKSQRSMERQWQDSPGRFSTGDIAKVTVQNYGQRYKGTQVTIQGKHDDVGMWIVESSRRKSPLVIADEHLDKIVVARAVAAA